MIPTNNTNQNFQTGLQKTHYKNNMKFDIKGNFKKHQQFDISVIHVIKTKAYYQTEICPWQVQFRPLYPLPHPNLLPAPDASNQTYCTDKL